MCYFYEIIHLKVSHDTGTKNIDVITSPKLHSQKINVLKLVLFCRKNGVKIILSSDRMNMRD